MKNLLFIILISFTAIAEETSQSLSLSQLNDLLSTTPQGPKVDCFDPNETPACEKITEQYCNDLGTNGGRLTDPTGSVNIGMSQKSELSEMERANLVDITRALPRLPQDLQRELQRPVERLSRLIEQENNSKSWYRDVSRVRNQIAEGIQDVANKRADTSLRAKIPRGQRATSADKAAERDAQYRSLMETFTQAKVDSSPNWPRIQSVYEKVKQDMITVLNTLPLTAEEKQQRLDKISQTRLSYPFGVRMGGVIGQIMESDCRTNMINAMYMPFTGTLTVCAGFLNGYQSENSLYFTLAHELAHSFNLKQIQNQTSQPRWSRLYQRMMETNGNVPCDEYNQLNTSERARPDSYNCGSESYNTFMNCLNNQRQAAPSNPNAAFAAEPRINYCEITDRRQGLAFMNPNEFVDRNFPKVVSSTMQEYTGPALIGARGMLMPAYGIVQATKCSPEKPCSEILQAERVRAAFGSTPPQCTRNSEIGAENESDWYAHKAMTLKLRNMTDIRARRQLVAGSMGLFCPFSYSRTLEDKDQKRLEEEFSKIAAEGGMSEDHHSTNEERIAATMTDEMASLLQCTKPGPIAPPGYQGCRL